jgi:endonuclease/exonuclease/phosphatase (EEP) superfamily protein YafD
MPEGRLSVKKYVIRPFSLLWDWLFRIWSIIIFTLAISVLANTVALWLTNRPVDVTYTFLYLWMSQHSLLTLLILLVLVVLSFCAYFAHRYQMQEIQKQSSATTSYNEKMTQLSASLTKASADVDSILQEMARIIQERQNAVSILEQKQTQLQKYIDSLQKGPAEPLKIFQEILAEEAKKQDQASRKMARRYFIAERKTSHE